MEITLRKKIAFRGWHIYGKVVWKTTTRGEHVFAEKEINSAALLCDPYAVAWKKRLPTRIVPEVVGHFPSEISCELWLSISHRGNINGTVDGPKYYASPIPNRGLEILINAEFKIASDELPFIERLIEIIKKNYHVPGNPRQMEIWTWKKLAWGDDETEDVLVIDGEGGDEDDDAIEYIHSDDAIASKMIVDEQ